MCAQPCLRVAARGAAESKVGPPGALPPSLAAGTAEGAHGADP